MATVDSAFKYWWDRFSLVHALRGDDAKAALARAAFAAGRAAQREDDAKHNTTGAK